VPAKNKDKRKRGRQKTTLPVELWAEARQVLGKQQGTQGRIRQGVRSIKWREFSEKIVIKIYGDINVGVKKEKKVASVSKRVTNKPKGVNKVYRPIT